MLYNEKILVTAIRNRRLYLNYTQEYVASRLRMSQNAYSKFELGYVSVTLDRFYDLCEALEIELEEMLQPALKAA